MISDKIRTAEKAMIPGGKILLRLNYKSVISVIGNKSLNLIGKKKKSFVLLITIIFSPKQKSDDTISRGSFFMIQSIKISHTSLMITHKYIFIQLYDKTVTRIPKRRYN